MKKLEDNKDSIEGMNENKGLHLLPPPKRESIYPDPELKALIEKMKGKNKRVKAKLADWPKAA